jgi:uncharacterized protein YbaA (DUF1428 family)
MRYVDGFVLPLPKKNLAAYRRMARAAAKVWMDHGALEFRETVGEDLDVKKGCGLAFSRAIRTAPGETVVFSWIAYRSRAHRDRVNARVMKDPRIAASMSGPLPFDVERMLYGGFQAIVEGRSRSRRGTKRGGRSRPRTGR